MKQDIRQRSRALLRDPELQANLHNALGLSLRKRLQLVQENPRWPLLREQCCQIRERGLDQLRHLIDKVQSTFEQRGATVTLCDNAEQAQRTITRLLQQDSARLVVKGKSMVSEELGLNAALEAEGMEVIEGDLGELIVQLRQEPPCHLTAPALHLNRHQIARLFHDRLGTAIDGDPVRLTLAARNYMRDRFRNADAGLCGANFVVAQSGTLVLVENESNIRLATTLPKTLVVVTGIEKLLSNLTDIAPLLEMLPTSATGQKMTAAVSLIGGPRQNSEEDGPQKLHLLLVDNGRLNLLADAVLRPALRCIRCGACLNVCPIFQRISGHGYGSVYPGPIGAVLSYALLGRTDSAHAFACSLCGACDDICPVQIPLTEMICEIRFRAQFQSKKTVEHLVHSLFASVGQQDRLFHAGFAGLSYLAKVWPDQLSTPLTAPWTEHRAMPTLHKTETPGRKK